MTEIFTASTSFWLYATLTLKERTTGATLAVVISNRPVISTTTRVYPILKDVSGLGAKMGQYLPQSMSGSITLENSPNSIGFERRFTDLLDRYEIIDQPVAVTAGFNPLGVETAGSQVFYGRVLDASADLNSNTYEIKLITAPIKTNDITRLIDSVTFPSAPIDSIGKYIPVVFGDDIDVKPIRISADNANPSSYAYGTNFGGYTNASATILVKDPKGTYYEITGPASTTTALLSSAGVRTASLGPPYDDYISGVILVTNSVLITSGRMQMRVGAAATYTGELRWALYEGVQTNTGSWIPQNEPLATAVYSKTPLGGTGPGPVTVDFTFDNPVLLKSSVGHYYLAHSQYSATVPTDDISIDLYTAAATPYWYKNITAANSTKWTKGTTGDTPIWYLYGPCYTDSPSGGAEDSNGLGYSYVSVEQRTVTNQTLPNLDEVDYIFSVGGIYYSHAYFVKPDEVAAVLGKEWNGSTWAVNASGDGYSTGNYNIYQGVLASGTYYREFRGAFHSRASVKDAFSALCENTACRICQALTGGFGLVPWGYEIPTEKVLTDENSKLVSIEQRGVETIVNDINIRYKKTVQSLSVEQGAISKEFKNYRSAITRNATTDPILAALSKSIFGAKPNDKAQCDFINDDTSAALMARYLLAVYPFPHWYVTIRAPLKDNSTVQLYQVVELMFPDLPAYFGTSALAKSAHYAGDEFVVDGITYLKRAKRYRAVVEGRESDFSSTNTPETILTCRLLLNYPNDPT